MVTACNHTAVAMTPSTEGISPSSLGSKNQLHQASISTTDQMPNSIASTASHI